MKTSGHVKDPDADLVRQVADGSEQAFAQLVEKYQQVIFNIIYRYIGNPDDVEDLAQEVFIKVWRNIAKFKGKSKFSTWLYRITANHCLTYRSKHKHPSISLDELSEREKVPKSLQVETDWEQKNKIELVKNAINELPERQRMALVLAQFEEKSYKEIANIMKISVSSVESLIFRARTALKKRFKKT